MSSRGTLRSGVHSNEIATGGGPESKSTMPGVYRSPPEPARRAGPLLLAAAACLAAGCAARDRDSPSIRLTETRRAMGVPWTITVCAASAPAGQAALAAAFAEIARLDAILSDYDPASELSQLSAASPMESPRRVSPDLWRVLAAAVEVRDASAGGFDPTVGPLATLWRQARRSGRLPLPDKLAAARLAVGPEALELVPPDGVLLPRPGTRLDLGGIGMGYAADRALEVLSRHGIGSALVDASGDVAASGPPPGETGWRIAVAPRAGAGSRAAPLELAHAAVTTSGDAFQAVEIDGVRYSHIVDPRTGLGVDGRSAVTVVAPDGTTADALATAASVLGPQAGLELVARRPGCAARFVWEAGGKIREATTPAWP
jgi:thiamine biosynthesis lipoprotein